MNATEDWQRQDFVKFIMSIRFVWTGIRLMCLLGVAVLAGSAAEPAGTRIPANYRLLYEQRFQQDSALEDFLFSDAKAWKVVKEPEPGALELRAQSDYRPPVRSPVNISLIQDKVFTDFILEADLIQTGKEYGHRDMCVYFGFQAPNKFYYAHIATAADDHAHNIFVVDGQPRTKIAQQTTKGVNWGVGVWHKLRLERKSSDGTIRVYFDDMEKPIMVAQDKRFTAGYVGFGSFDDTGKIANIRIWGPALEIKKADFFGTPKPAATR